MLPCVKNLAASLLCVWQVDSATQAGVENHGCQTMSSTTSPLISGHLTHQFEYYVSGAVEYVTNKTLCDSKDEDVKDNGSIYKLKQRVHLEEI